MGAEAIYMAGHPKSGIGVAVKVEDGAWRAAPPALLAVLDRAGVLSPGTMAALADFAAPVIRNTLDDVVGRMRIREVPCS